MNAIVTARVPAEIKLQVDKELKAMGSSATELINAAYAFVLAEGCLPRPSEKVPEKQPGPCVKSLSSEDAAEFKSAWGKRAVLKASGYDGTNFKELLDEARGQRHARFA